MGVIDLVAGGAGAIRDAAPFSSGFPGDRETGFVADLDYRTLAERLLVNYLVAGRRS